MTDPEDTQQDAALDSESSTDEAAADVDEEQWVEAATADYQARLREFENVESTPVVSLPGDSSQLGEGDLEVQPPSDPSG
ncbi:MAG: hypothetical protein ACRDSL_08495 [Pseudonocardiaceae bacterium]